MPTKPYELSARAVRDLHAILRQSGRQFGSIQQEKYAHLILRAFELAAGEPHGPGARYHDEIAPGLCSLRVDRVASRHGAASHVVFYKQAVLKDGVQGVYILRILHEYMDPARHLVGYRS
jgi:toxin ParE1/3/4